MRLLEQAYENLEFEDSDQDERKAHVAPLEHLSKIHGMNVGDINWSPRSIRVTGKGDKQRLVLFGESAALALRDTHWLAVGSATTAV